MATNKLIIFSVLTITFLLIPATIARSSPKSDREARQLLLNSYAWYDSAPVVPVTSSYSTPVFAVETRQAHATENSQLGPFFGYFPNIFSGNPCICPTPEKQKGEKITVCGNELSTVLSSAPEGTISLSPDVSSLANNDHATCYVGLVASYPNTKISVKCDSKPNDVVLSMSDAFPAPNAQTGAAQSETYVSTKPYVILKAYENTPQKTFNLECTWKSVP